MIKKIFVLLFAFIFLGITSFFLLGYQFANHPASIDTEEVIFEVPKGPFSSTSRKLKEMGLITNKKHFTWYAQFRGDITKIKVGEYLLQKNWSPRQILDKIISGDIVKYKFTVPEGYNVFEIAKLLEEKGFVSKKKFLSYVRNSKVAKKISGLEVSSLEGFLFPETYQFSKNTDVSVIVSAMYNQFDRVYESIIKEKNKIQMDKLKLVTMASIIEKETGAPEERPMISSVFHNRLKKKMRLQSDPTILYGVMVEEGRWLKNIQRSHIKKKTAYNTYTIKALPPAPIANPGRDALRAAINPVDSSYLYFVSQNDGRHIFTKSYKDHMNAVRKYQLNSKARKGKSWRDLKKKK